LFEVDQAANRIREEVDEDANIIFGSAIDEGLQGKVRVSVVATGIDSPAMSEAQRPRLVAVGGNAMPGPIPMPAAMAAQAAAQAEAAQPGFVPGPVALQRQAAAQPGGHHAPATIDQRSEPSTSQPGQAAARHQPAGAPQPPGPARAAPQPGQQPAQRGGLFADAPRTTVATSPAAGNPAVTGQAVNGTEPRRSIFQTVTGRLRNTLAGVSNPPAEPAQPRAEPQIHEAKPEPARASVRPAVSEDMGLDIPAFLRRQSS
jgi:cell division protein FtsZ